MAENNRNDDDSDINNEKYLCLSFIESFENPHNLSLEVDKNTSLSLKKIVKLCLMTNFSTLMSEQSR